MSSPILEANSYYPFGLEQKGIGVGKELRENLELDQFDYGARIYDAQIAKWRVLNLLA
ncbi:MAG TPA: hypothetical protein VL053_11935 [Arachidicoccus sp.]|nr:hypothetical protein [Arachidicoccus sp.]